MGANELERLARAERWERLQIPLLGLAAIAAYAGSRFASTRALEGVLVALGIPVLASFASLRALRDSRAELRRLALIHGVVLLVSAESQVVPSLWPFAAHRSGDLCWIGLGVSAILATVVEAWSAHVGIRLRTVAWALVAATFSIYLPSHVNEAQTLESVLVAALVALFVGGGTGLVWGALAVRVGRWIVAVAERRS